MVEHSKPGLLTTLVNCLALAFIENGYQLERFSEKEPVFTSIAAMCLGYTIGHLFSLDVLRRSQDPAIRELLANAVV
ncbi:MAG: hypothetical protein H0V82_04205 [Candidatus Protochlamydia sp.]|nr:hypothetical protein [Candidatus Protochlamydia sp.]